MAERPAPRERLQPSLLDRLTDDDPDKTREAVQDRVLTPRQLRRCVLRDLAWLFNTSNYEANPFEGSKPLNEVHPLVARSVLNFGVPDLTGRLVAGMTPDMLEDMLREAILRFEPRILPGSIRVRAVIDRDEMSGNTIGFEIEGELWSQPVPMRLLLRTEIDVESGHVAVQESETVASAT